MNTAPDRGRSGRYVTCAVAGDAPYKAYIPADLPPHPPLDMNALYPLLDRASAALGRLDGMSGILPDPNLFLYMYIRKEAVLSSQIEGTQSSFSDLLLYEMDEAPGVPIDDAAEVSCYVAAMNYGLERLRDMPMSLRLIREIHARLMDNARGGGKTPGEFRTIQNWLGGPRPENARFVPPPPERLMDCLAAFEAFLHDENVKLPLIKAALAHVQFETIHPFLDGNGRLGRLLITFILCTEGVLNRPLLYLSLYFKANRQAYYDHLQSVRETGDWEGWIAFFLTGVIETAGQAAETAEAVISLFRADRAKVRESGKAATAISPVYEFLQRRPISNARKIKEACGVSLPTALRALKTLQDLGVVREITGKPRRKIFAYEDYIALLNEGAAPLAD